MNCKIIKDNAQKIFYQPHFHPDDNPLTNILRIDHAKTPVIMKSR